MNILQPYQGRYVSAESASNKLDVETIISGCDAVENDALSINSFAQSLLETGSTLDEKVLSVNGKTFLDQVDADVENIANVQTQISESVCSIREAAVAIYNQIQDQLNVDAENRDLDEINRRENNNG